MSIHPSKNQVENDFSHFLECAVRDIRTGEIKRACKKIDDLVSSYFDFTKSIEPQVKVFMDCVSSKWIKEKGTIEKMISASLALHESTETISLND